MKNYLTDFAMPLHTAPKNRNNSTLLRNIFRATLMATLLAKASAQSIGIESEPEKHVPAAKVIPDQGQKTPTVKRPDFITVGTNQFPGSIMKEVRGAEGEPSTFVLPSYLAHPNLNTLEPGQELPLRPSILTRTLASGHKTDYEVPRRIIKVGDVPVVTWKPVDINILDNRLFPWMSAAEQAMLSDVGLPIGDKHYPKGWDPKHNNNFSCHTFAIAMALQLGSEGLTDKHFLPGHIDDSTEGTNPTQVLLDHYFTSIISTVITPKKDPLDRKNPLGIRSIAGEMQKGDIVTFQLTENSIQQQDAGTFMLTGYIVGVDIHHLDDAGTVVRTETRKTMLTKFGQGPIINLPLEIAAELVSAKKPIQIHLYRKNESATTPQKVAR